MPAKRLAFPKKYEHFAAVLVPPGRNFPLDGLRYDHCMPLKETDSRLITDQVNIASYGEGKQPVVILLHKYSESATPNWTAAFWQGNGVTLDPISEHEADNINSTR